MSVSYWLNKTSTTSQFDVVIVGAGIAGLSTAYWLEKQDPNLKVAIVDKSSLGGGASGRNAGFITCGSVEHFNRLVHSYGKDKALELWRFSETNMELLKSEIVDQDATALQFGQDGTFSLASEDKEFAELKEVAKLMDELNIDVETLSSSDVEKRVGAVNFVGGIKYLNDGYVHPVKLLEAIHAKTKAKLLTGVEVYDIQADGNGQQLIKTNNGNLECSIVVLATNAYSPLLDDYFKDKISATKGQILMTEPVEQFMEGPCYANFVLDYFRQIPSGELLIGGFRQLEKETEVGYSDHTTEKIQQALQDFVQTYLPRLKNKAIDYRWAGVMGFSRDGQPFIGALPHNNQVFFLGGFTAHGLGLAFHTGKCLVDLIFGNEYPEFLSARRLETN